MAGRRDALMAAAELSLAMRDAAREVDGAVVTVGDARITDPASNVVPGHVSLSVDARAPTEATLAALVQELSRAAEATAARTRGQAGSALAQRPRRNVLEYQQRHPARRCRGRCGGGGDGLGRGA